MAVRLIALLAVALLAPPAGAQEQGGGLPPWHPLRPDRVAEEREEPPASMSEGFYRRLSRVHELIEEDNPAEALELMDRIRIDRLGDYEGAQLYQTYGFAYSQLGREDETFDAFEKCLELDALPTAVQQGIVYSTAGYYAGQERFEESNQALLRWFRYQADPIPDAYILMGANFAGREMMREALPYVARANQLSEQPNESWRNLELAIRVELEQFAQAIELLKENIGIWPDNLRYYVVLSSLYMQTENDEGALAALTIPWFRGMLVKESDILSLARLNLFLSNPVRAGMVLEEAMKRGNVEENADNFRVLLNAWTMAREMDRAVGVIEKLAQLSDDGEYYHRKAMLLNESGDWEGVVESCRLAIEKGGLERPGDVWVLKGVALAELRRFDDAMEAFQSAKRDGNDNIRRNANAWISYVRDRAGGAS